MVVLPNSYYYYCSGKVILAFSDSFELRRVSLQPSTALVSTWSLKLRVTIVLKFLSFVLMIGGFDVRGEIDC